MRNHSTIVSRLCGLVLVLGAVALPRNADACSCVMSATNCAAAATAAAVFEATVDAIEPDRSSDRTFGQLSTVRLSNVKAYRGDAAMAVVTPGLGGSCGYPFEAGERYLIVAGRSRDGRLMVTLCGLTRPVAAAGPLVDYVKALSNRVVETRVWGTVFKSTARGQDSPRQVRDAVVTLHGPKEVVTRTDAEGRFLVTGLAPGSYSATARVPGATDVLEPYLGDFDLEPDTPHACAELHFEVPATGRVTGLVLNEQGNPLPGAFVQLQVLDTSGTGKRVIPWLGMETDDEGRYDFVETPPATYQLALGSVLSGHIFARTSNDATTFEVSDGQMISLEPLRSEPIPRLSTEVTVRDSSGAPVPGIEVQPLILDHNDDGYYDGKPVVSDAEGKLIVQLLKDQRYRLIVGSHVAPRAESTLAADGAPLTLVLRH